MSRYRLGIGAIGECYRVTISTVSGERYRVRMLAGAGWLVLVVARGESG